MTIIESLRAKLSQLLGSMEAITAAADAEQRALAPEEQAQFDQLDAQYRATEGEIARRERLEEVQNKATVPVPRTVQPMDNASATPPPQSGATSVSGGTAVAHGYAHHGFKKGIGEFLVAVRNVRTSGHVDPRLLVNAVSTFGGESVGGDGGYLLPPQFAQEILQAVQGFDTFVSALKPTITNSNLLVVPTDETTPWGAVGITGAKTAEGAVIAASKPAIKQVSIQLYAAKSLVHVSDENLRDVPFLASYVMAKMGEKLRYLVENWAMNGEGAGAEPLGLLKGPGLVTQAKESSQTRATTPLVSDNLFKMYASLLPGGASRAFWVMNPTVLPSLWALNTGSGGAMLYYPDLTKAPAGLLMGRPVYLSETCAIAGTAGDIVLVDPAGYIFATQSEGIATAATIAFAFDQGLQSFRATYRCGGAPMLQAKIARAKSSSTYAGHIINLGT
jgi:HK97 family phage major capsid protein